MVPLQSGQRREAPVALVTSTTGTDWAAVGFGTGVAIGAAVVRVADSASRPVADGSGAEMTNSVCSPHFWQFSMYRSPALLTFNFGNRHVKRTHLGRIIGV